MPVASNATITAFLAWTISYYAAFSGDARSLSRIFRACITGNEIVEMAVASRYKSCISVNCLNSELLNLARSTAAICYTEKNFRWPR